MFIDLINNFKLMSTLIIMLFSIHTAYSITSIYKNVILLNDLFSFKKLFSGLLKLSLLCTSLFLITAVVSVFPRTLTEFNFVIIDNDVLENMSMLTMIVIMSSGIYKYFNLSIINIKNILSISSSDLIEIGKTNLISPTQDNLTNPYDSSTLNDSSIPSDSTNPYDSPVPSISSTTSDLQAPKTSYKKFGNEVLTFRNADETKIKNLIKAYDHTQTTYEYIVIHNNGNTKSTAWNDVSWAINNIGTANVSWHYSVDENEVVRFLAHPSTYGSTCWSGGDGTMGKCNYTGINIEICEYDAYNNPNDTQYLKSYYNAINLVAQILYDQKWDTSRVIQHYDCSGKNCPRVIRKYGFDKFINDVQSILNELNKR